MFLSTKITTSTIILILTLSFILVSIPEVRLVKAASEIIRIREDGTVEGTDKIQRDGDIYTLTGDINGSVGAEEAFIFVENHNIVIDGAGYTIQGTGQGTGILMMRRQNVTIKNVNIKGFGTGINFWAVHNWPPDSKYWGLEPASNNRILDNNITIPVIQGIIEAEVLAWGIYLQEAHDTLISGNTITSQDPKSGVFCGDWSCYNNTFLNNRFVGCGLFLTSSNQNTILNNMVDSKRLIHFEGASNQVIDGAGQVFLFNCNNMTVKNVDSPVDLTISVYLSGTTNSEITNCSGHISLADSRNNTISENRLVNAKSTVRTSALCALELLNCQYNTVFGNDIAMSGETWAGSECIHISNSAYNNIYGNNIYGTEVPNKGRAIYLTGSTSNSIHGNNITKSETAIYSASDTRETIYQNNFEGCNVAISMSSSSGYSVFANNITNCITGVSIFESNNNAFYHNNFIDNKQHVFEQHESYYPPFYRYSVNNTWDNGVDGNYWSDYNGTDNNGDGIGDTPYTVYENYTDRYPLMNPVVIQEFPDTTPPFPTWIVAAIVIIAVVGAALLVYFAKVKKTTEKIE